MVTGSAISHNPTQVITIVIQKAYIYGRCPEKVTVNLENICILGFLREVTVIVR